MTAHVEAPPAGSGAGAKRPKVSIGLPTFQGERFIQAAIESLLGQTFSDFELTISDNASTDATGRICQEFASRDARVRYVRQPTNTGLFANLEFVLAAARGEFCMLVGDDDVYDPHYVERLLGLLDGQPHIGLAYSGFSYIHTDGQIVPSGFRQFFSPSLPAEAVFGRYLRYRPCLPMIMGVFRTAVIQPLLPVQTFDKMTGDVDNLLMLKTIATGVRVASTPQVLFFYRLKDRAASFPSDYPDGSWRRRVYQFRHNVEFTRRVWRILDRSVFPVHRRVRLKVRSVAELIVLFAIVPVVNVARQWRT